MVLARPSRPSRRVHVPVSALPKASAVKLLIAVVAVALGATALITAPAVASAAPVLSTEGVAEYELQALMYQNFGPEATGCNKITLHGHTYTDWWWRPAQIPPSQGYAENCTRMDWLFNNYGHSAYHFLPAGFSVPSLRGITSGPVVLNGRLVACNGSSSEVLVEFGSPNIYPGILPAIECQAV